MPGKGQVLKKRSGKKRQRAVNSKTDAVTTPRPRFVSAMLTPSSSVQRTVTSHSGPTQSLQPPKHPLAFNSMLQGRGVFIFPCTILLYV